LERDKCYTIGHISHERARVFPVWTLFLALFLMLLAMGWHWGGWVVWAVFVGWWVAFAIWNKVERRR
jgi:hypothetical protein